MPRYIRDTIAYDPRTGKKVRYDDIVEDGEQEGLFVAAEYADEINMQRFPVEFFPEGVLDKAYPPAERDDITMRVGSIYEAEPSFSLLTVMPAYGGGSSIVETDTLETEVVTYMGENITYLGDPVTYTGEVA